MSITLYGGGQSVIQVASTTFDGTVSTSAAGAPNIITNGVQLFSITFTPLSATSQILVQTSTIVVAEESNVGDMPWLSLFAGSNFIAANGNSSLYSHFSGNLNVAHHSLNHVFASWGTSAQAVTVRAGINAGTAYINGHSLTAYTYSGNQARISMTITEIATS